MWNFKLFFCAALLLTAGSLLSANEWNIKIVNGVPRMAHNGEIEKNFIFCAARIDRGNKVEITSVTSEVRIARKHDVKIYSISMPPFWHGPDDKKAQAFADHIVERVLENDPDAYFWPRVQMSQWYPNDDLRELNLSADGSRDQASVANPNYRKRSAQALRDYIRYMEKKYGKHMAGYHVAGAHHGEFQYCNFARYGNLFGYDEGSQQAFRQYLKKKYKGNVSALRKAWRNKPGVTFENAMVPAPYMRYGSRDRVFHDPRTEQPAIDFNEFLNSDMAEFIIELARVVREECGKTRLTGVFYGYLFECMPQGNGPSQSGHFGLAKLINSPDLDMLCGPYSYSNQARVPGAPQFTHTVGESITAAGKIWCNEDDTATHISMKQRIPEDGSHRAAFDRTLEETRMLVRRNLVFNIARNYGVWWFDHHSKGMWNDPELWKEKTFADKVEAPTLKEPHPYTADVVLTFDEKNANFIVGNDAIRTMLEGGISVLRDRVNRSGCTSGTWFLNDIVAGKEKHSKLDIHGNAVALTAAERKALRKRAEKVPTVWMWAPGYIDIDKNEFSLKAMEEVTGFKVRRVKPATWCVWSRPEGFDYGMPDHYGWGKTLDPVFAPIPEKGDLVLAYWRDLWGTPAIVLRPGKNGKAFSVFCGTVDIPASVVRALARKAGANIYCSRDAGIHKGRDFVAITANQPGLYDLNVGGSAEWFDADTGKSLGFGPQLKLNLKWAETVVACKKNMLDK